MGLQVRRLMKREVVKVRPQTTVEEFHRLLTSRDISGAPVVDEDGTVLGVISQTDVVQLLSGKAGGDTGSFYSSRPGTGGNEKPGEKGSGELLALKVAEVMERRIYSVHPGDGVSTAAGMMRRHGIHRVLVVDDAGRLEGILSSLDLMQIIEEVDLFDEYYHLRKRAVAEDVAAQ